MAPSTSEGDAVDSPAEAENVETPSDNIDCRKDDEATNEKELNQTARQMEEQATNKDDAVGIHDNDGNENEEDARKPETTFPKRPSHQTKKHYFSKDYIAPRHLEAASLEKYRTPGRRKRRNMEDLLLQVSKTDATSQGLVSRVQFMARQSATTYGGMPSEYASSRPSLLAPSAKTRRKERNKALLANPVTGAGWFDMKSNPMTDDLKQDMLLLRNRNYLDPKRFYKSADTPLANVKARVVQRGTVVEGAAEYYSARLPKKQRRQTLVEEVMADSKTKAYVTDKFRARNVEGLARHRAWRKANPKATSSEFRKSKK